MKAAIVHSGGEAVYSVIWSANRTSNKPNDGKGKPVSI